MRDTIEENDLQWSVVESLPVSEDIKLNNQNSAGHIRNYKTSLRSLAKSGINTVCYNFIPVLDWARTDLKYIDKYGTEYPFHYHAEYEIVYIVKSTGKRIVGNNIEDYSDGDLALYGNFVPHIYLSDANYHSNNSDLRAKAFTLQFSKEFFKTSIECYPEFQKNKI